MAIQARYEILDNIYESKSSTVYRTYSRTYGRNIIIKQLKPNPTPERVAWFKREYKIIKSIQITGVIKAYELKYEKGQWTMILEDFGGESLCRIQKYHRFTLEECLTLAIVITTILGKIHQNRIIHKNINPSNLILNPYSGEVKFIDFGIATELPKENQSLQHPSKVEGTLAYISPEQSGRMNREIDYRTDLYSFGITLFELLTGEPPFQSANALDLIHQHIAKQPPSPSELNPEIPNTVSAIILKLLAKNAEDRYQSAYGLQMDLEECQRQWLAKNRIDEFEIGQKDRNNQFQIPQKLYGREKDIEKMLAVFNSIMQGSSELLLITGYTGIGKSALAQEMYRPITRTQGYFIVGKCDQYQRTQPYAPLIQAFQLLIQQILAESPDRIAEWQSKILSALGDKCQIIIDVIPQLNLILNQKTTNTEAEARNRFNVIFQKLVSVFASKDHPLVLFLDDLQWANVATLKLIKLLLTSEIKYLYIIAAYRSNEVDKTHPVSITVEQIQKTSKSIHTIQLNPLTLSEISQLLIDSLNESSVKISQLAWLLLEKTNGNPFFVNEFLKSIHSQGLLVFSETNGTWEWEIKEIQNRAITDNVVDLMIQKLQSLDKSTQKILQLAACVGDPFDLEILALIAQQEIQTTAAALHPALTEGLIYPLKESYKLLDVDLDEVINSLNINYRFAHDQIQQAAYSLADINENSAIHYRIGQLLLHHIPAELREEYLFEIVNHLNLSQNLIQSRLEKQKLVILNLTAARKARRSAAFQTALQFLQVNLSLLDADDWNQNYNFTLKSHIRAAEAAYLSGNFAEMRGLVEIVLEKSKTLLDKVEAYKILLKAYQSENNFILAIQTGLQVLELLGIKLPEQPDNNDINRSLAEARAAWEDNPIEELLNLPPMPHGQERAIMEILFEIVHPCFVCSPPLFTLVATRMVIYSITNGNSTLSANAYACYATVLLSVTKDLNSAYQFGQIALQLVDDLDAIEQKPAVLFLVNSFIRHWKVHHNRTLAPMLEAYQIGLETGQFQFAAFGAYCYSYILFLSGENLNIVLQEIQRYHTAINQINEQSLLLYQSILWQVTLNLVEESEFPWELKGQVFNPEKFLPLLKEVNERFALAVIHLNKAILAYLFHHYDIAFENIEITATYVEGISGTPFFAAFYLYQSLIYLAYYPNASSKKQLLNTVNENQVVLQQWSNNAPTNFLHKYYLLQAELNRITRKKKKASEYYSLAIAQSQEQGFINETALAYELAGQFYLKSNPTEACKYLQNAYYTYQSWGAIAKTKTLLNRYQEFLEIPEIQSHAITLDEKSILEATQMLSAISEPQKAIEQLLKSMLQTTGAEKGYLLIKRNEWKIEAKCKIDDESFRLNHPIPLPLDNLPYLPINIINFVIRTRENVILDHAYETGPFIKDPYIAQTRMKSVLCTALQANDKPEAILYLENQLATAVFGHDRLQILRLLYSQGIFETQPIRSGKLE